jgi:7-methyl-GTP pyrophosphatase
MASPKRIVLASASTYRRELLERLGLPFECASPQVDESEIPGETPAETALRLSVLKAKALALRFPDSILIGCDQVACCDGARMGKPGNHANALRQLESMSGKTVTFETALTVLDASRHEARSRVVPCRVTFRRLSRAQIEAYLEREQPYDCAGSAKVEGLGIALIARIETEDPTSLIGLPLIALTELFAESGVPVLG